MKNSLHKLLAGLTVLLLFPVVIAVFYEYSRINDSEKLISTVYKNQLETIVSSINSYVQDVADNWGSRLEMGLKFAEDTSGIERLVSENKSINGIYLSATDQQTETIYQKNADGLSQDSLNLFLLNNQDEVIRLKNYYKNGYQKFVSHFLSKEHVVLFFVGEGRNNQLQVFLIDVNLPLFLQNHIRPRIQSIARDNFLIALYLKNREEILVSTEKSISQNQEYDQKGEMWLFPFLEIGITLKEQTIADLARSRIKEGLILMGIVLFVLVGGVWFLFSSVKREIQLTQIKSEFIANVSHEIRTPLALISMYIETLEMGRVKSLEKVKEYYGIIGKETQRLTGIVNKILNFSKLEKGKRHFKLGTCDLNAVTGEVLETYRFHLEKKGFEVVFSPKENLPFNWCDKESIGDAIINLIDNAQKYSDGKKRIEIKTGEKKKYTFVEVKDFGPGISKKHQKLIFDKFYRITSGDLANQVKGSGLGLAIVSEIVKAHHGRISLNSRPGEGAAFRLYLPKLHTQKG